MRWSNGLSICAVDHDDIAYVGLDCPLCEVTRRLRTTEQELDAEKETLEVLAHRLDQLENDLRESTRFVRQAMEDEQASAHESIE